MSPKLPVPSSPSARKNTSMIPSLVPMQAFSLDEDAAFEEMEDDAEIEALVDVLFPDSIVPA
jgi:hypothetical protein